eukprot:TRINITY_DN3590_c0_g3_i2.p1 TRINITY_DN3590_c0_g3~~TRINITY_DN3590_c0_g3_i2.p1  ORF type:complete len:111 (+),score=15.78 TRINITY_DN3590_c0_g3_i2:45-377(+)
MDSHVQLPGRPHIDGVSYQQTMQMLEYKYSEHLKKLREKWDVLKKQLEKECKSILNTHLDGEIMKNHTLPLARVKKIMKSDEDVKVTARISVRCLAQKLRHSLQRPAKCL